MITLEQIKGLGFETEYAFDSVYLREFGIPYFIVSKKLTKKIGIFYNIESCSCELLRCKKNGDVINRMKIIDIDTLIGIIAFFNQKNQNHENT